MRIILTGGGTAGHINPALAIGEYIRSHDKSSEFIFVGRSGGEENKAVLKSGFVLKELKIRGLIRKVTFHNLAIAASAIKAVKEAKRLIREFKPNAIIGTGGYVSFPCIYAGISLGIPTFIHESNAVPGIVTKLLGKKCTSVLLNLDGAREHLTKCKNIVTVGNPVRMSFEHLTREQTRKKLGISKNEMLIVSFGGSGGSSKMNECCISLMKNYSMKKKNIKHIHASGAKYYPSYEKGETSLCRGISGCKITRYIDNMHEVLCACDLAVARCGAVTLSELAFAGVPSVLIPSPNVTGNHQYKNAEYFKENCAAVLLEEKELDDELLKKTVSALLNDKKACVELSENIRRLYMKNAAETVYNVISENVGKI